MKILIKNSSIKFETFDETQWKSATYTLSQPNQLVDTLVPKVGKMYKVVFDEYTDGSVCLYSQTSGYLSINTNKTNVINICENVGTIQAKSEDATSQIKFHFAYANEFGFTPIEYNRTTPCSLWAAVSPSQAKFVLPDPKAGTYKCSYIPDYSGSFIVYLNKQAIYTKTVTEGTQYDFEFTADADFDYSSDEGLLLRSEESGVTGKFKINKK